MSVPWAPAQIGTSARRWWDGAGSDGGGPGGETDLLWWDGSTLQAASLLGWWDGSAIRPVSLLGWWDGSAIQPLS